MQMRYLAELKCTPACRCDGNLNLHENANKRSQDETWDVMDFPEYDWNFVHDFNASYPEDINDTERDRLIKNLQEK